MNFLRAGGWFRGGFVLRNAIENYILLFMSAFFKWIFRFILGSEKLVKNFPLTFQEWLTLFGGGRMKEKDKDRERNEVGMAGGQHSWWERLA